MTDQKSSQSGEKLKEGYQPKKDDAPSSRKPTRGYQPNTDSGERPPAKPPGK